MARTSTKSTTKTKKASTKKAEKTTDTVVEKSTTDTVNEVVETKTNTKVKTKKVEIDKDELIDVVSLVPNVSYYDKKTDDRYEWEEIGDIIPVPYEVIENIWRQYKDYFRGLCIKPIDERVIEKLNMGRIFDKYDIITDPDNYNRKKVDNVIEILNKSSLVVKTSVFNMIKTFVSDGKISDIQVIVKLDKAFDLDLVTLIG